jgi:hypothetical protein
MAVDSFLIALSLWWRFAAAKRYSDADTLYGLIPCSAAFLRSA